MNEKETKKDNSRVIKFRAWDIEDKTMRSVEEIKLNATNWKPDTSYIAVWLSLKDGGAGIMSRKTETQILQQFTGLKDKNGKEIYESDYLEIPEVNDNSKAWCVFWGSGKYILHNISTGDILDCNEENTNKKEIAGNRFESHREHKAMETDL